MSTICCVYEYELESGDFCDEPKWESSDCCILHIDLPEKDDPELKTISQAKKARTEQKIEAGNFNFEGGLNGKIGSGSQNLNY